MRKMFVFINPLSDAKYEIEGNDFVIQNNAYNVRVRDEKTKVWSVTAIFPTTYVVLIKEG